MLVPFIFRIYPWGVFRRSFVNIRDVWAVDSFAAVVLPGHDLSDRLVRGVPFAGQLPEVSRRTASPSRGMERARVKMTVSNSARDECEPYAKPRNLIVSGLPSLYFSLFPANHYGRRKWLRSTLGTSTSTIKNPIAEPEQTGMDIGQALSSCTNR